MQPALPTPRNGSEPGPPASPVSSVIFNGSDAPLEPNARKNRSMSQQPSSEVPVQPAQPSVGSLAAHRPNAVAGFVVRARRPVHSR